MNNLRLLPPGAAVALLLAACASIGRPEGGPRDTEPPRYVRSNPMPGSLNVSQKKISVFFDENVQLEDPGSRIAISPVQKTNPRVSANGRRVDIELEDSLLPNTTYTIDLADAVKDLNEGNPLDGFAIDFSTGPEIDTLQISGMVLEARTLEPAQGMLVGVYDSDADSCITTTRFSRIARTNQFGQFTVRNLAPGNYQLFALNDLNRDFHWDRTEDVAFHSTLISPSVESTTFTDSLGNDSTSVRLVPDNVLLTWFNEQYKAQYLKDYKRLERNVLYLQMAAPTDSLPRLSIVSIGSRHDLHIPLDSISVMTRNETADSLNFWLTDTAVIAADSLLVETTYRRVDSLDRIVWATDTLKFNFRSPRGKKPQRELSLQEKIDSILATNDTVKVDTFALMQPTEWVDVSMGGSSQDLNKPAFFSTNRPIGDINFDGIRLEMKPDSLWVPLDPQPQISLADSLSMTRLTFDTKWIPGTAYRLVVDSMAIHDIYGVYNRPTNLEFKARKVDDYSTISFDISGIPDSVSAIVELLNGEDKPILSRQVEGATVVLDYILPATYYARLFFDTDSNGQWSNGRLLERVQPEDVYYFPKKLTLKKNWDRNESWDINAISPDLQKPQEIKKNKPKPKPGEQPEQKSDADDEDEDLDGFGTNHFNPNGKL